MKQIEKRDKVEQTFCLSDNVYTIKIIYDDKYNEKYDGFVYGVEFDDDNPIELENNNLYEYKSKLKKMVESEIRYQINCLVVREEKKCIICNNDYTGYGDYCSKQCSKIHSIAEREKRKKKCPVCEKDHYRYHKCCSKECTKIYNAYKPKEKLDDIDCAHCGKSFTPSTRRAKHCSAKCRNAAGRLRQANGTAKKRVKTRETDEELASCSVECLLEEFGDIE